VDEDHKLLSRIISGLLIFDYNNIRYSLRYPSTRLKYESELYYSSIYDDYKFHGWLTKEDVLLSLKEYGVWSVKKEQELEDTKKQIETLKIELFKSLVQPRKQKSIKLKLKGLKLSQEKYLSIKHSLDYMTIEGYCENLKNQFLIINSLYRMINNNEMEQLFSDTTNIDYTELESISNEITKHNIDISTFRRLARSDIWKNYWSAHQDTIFPNAVVDWTDEQRTLVLFTRMYESARNSTECPPEAVFNDDDMFDGWMALQHEKNDKDKQEKLEENSFGKKMAKSQEVFFFAGEARDAREIHEMNSNTSKAVVKERNQAIIKNKELKASKLPDIERELSIKSQELLKNKLRKK
jgi:hypothetical protein